MNDRSYPARPILAASVAVFRDGKVLLASRTQPPAQFRFSLPGGVVEVGETLEEAALRELFEEVGVIARIVGFSGHLEVIERDEDGKVRRHFVVTAFAAEWVSGEPQTGPEAGAVLWATDEHLESLTTTPGLADILAKARGVFEAA